MSNADVDAEKPRLLRSYLSSISSYDSIELVQRRELGPLSFEDAKPYIDQAVQLSKELLPLDLSLLPISKIDEILATSKPLIDSLDQLDKFDVLEPDPAQRRQRISNAVRVHSDSFRSTVIFVLPYLILKTPSFQTVIQQSDALVQTIEHKVDAKTNELDQKVGQKIEALDSALQVVRDAAAKTGVSKHAEVFSTAASKHDTFSRYWLISAAGLVALTVTVALIALYKFPVTGDLKEATTIQRIIGKVVLISILYYSAIWSAKNYRAHRHLAVLNDHRQNALKTFETFVAGAGGDEQTKNAVLLEATHSIFSPANTGYLGQDEENPSGRVIEILKTFTSSTAGK